MNEVDEVFIITYKLPKDKRRFACELAQFPDVIRTIGALALEDAYEVEVFRAKVVN